MAFGSMSFLFGFLPLTLLCYFLMPRRWRSGRNLVLLLFSLAFYCWGGVRLLPAFAVSCVGNWAAALLSAPGRRHRKAAYAAAVVLNVLMLGYYKYTGFLLGNLAALGMDVTVPSIALPAGISFFTFQAVAYLTDVYRGTIPAERNLGRVTLFMAFFPQLLQGPILRYGEFGPEILQRRETADEAADGAVRFCFGLAKKVLLADALGQVADGAFSAGDQLTVSLAWLGAVAYTLQLYFDFSGYSMMGIGMGKMLGFDFPQNFNYPYISASITEFWRRWHMTLSGWFREYVYIPLGGNRKGLKRQIFNLFVVELLTGIWHGANWNFICWGLYYFVLLAIEKLFLLQYLQKGKVWPHIYTLFLVVVGWAMFVGNDTGVSFGLLFQKLFVPSGGVSPLYFLRNYGVLLAVSVVCCTPLIEKLWNLLRRRTPTRVATILVLLVVSTAYVVGSTNSPFLYFNF